MTTQTEMFPKTELDEAQAILRHLETEQEKADAAVAKAEDKASDASTRVWKQRHVVDRLQSMMPAAEPVVEAEASEDVEDGELVDEAHQIEGDTLDPITGEVTSKEERGEGSVRSWWPEADEPMITDVGPATQYAELVADYIAGNYASVGAMSPPDDELEHYSVIAVGDGRLRKLHAAIAPEDHGLEFAVVYGTAADLEPELRTCANCGTMPSECAMSLDDPTDGMGCGGNGWTAVCPACDGDGRIPDATGGGHHGSCPECRGSGRVEAELEEDEEEVPAA